MSSVSSTLTRAVMSDKRGDEVQKGCVTWMMVVVGEGEMVMRYDPCAAVPSMDVGFEIMKSTSASERSRHNRPS